MDRRFTVIAFITEKSREIDWQDTPWSADSTAAIRYEIGLVGYDPHSTSAHRWILHNTFEMLNSPSPSAWGDVRMKDIDEYHQIFPSFSSGDQVLITDQTTGVKHLYRCRRSGWDKFEMPKALIF